MTTRPIHAIITHATATLLATAMVAVLGATAGRAAAPAAGHPGCATQLAAMRTVSRQARVVVGSTRTGKPSPRAWARELRAGGLPEVAKAAAAIRDHQSDELFVLALTSTAAADLADVTAHRACRG